MNLPREFEKGFFGLPPPLMESVSRALLGWRLLPAGRISLSVFPSGAKDERV